MTWLDVIILLVVAAAAIAGFRRLGGSARAGRLLGLLVGAGLGAAWGARLSGFGDTPGSAYLLGLLGILAGLMLGGWLGGLVTRVLARAHLSLLDRAVGALAGGVGALLVIWLVSWVVPAVVGPEPLEPVTGLVDALGGSSSVVASVGQMLPDTTATAREIVGEARPPV